MKKLFFTLASVAIILVLFELLGAIFGYILLAAIAVLLIVGFIRFLPEIVHILICALPTILLCIGCAIAMAVIIIVAYG